MNVRARAVSGAAHASDYRAGGNVLSDFYVIRAHNHVSVQCPIARRVIYDDIISISVVVSDFGHSSVHSGVNRSP